jgi:hypothetical protein
MVSEHYLLCRLYGGIPEYTPRCLHCGTGQFVQFYESHGRCLNCGTPPITQPLINLDLGKKLRQLIDSLKRWVSKISKSWKREETPLFNLPDGFSL